MKQQKCAFVGTVMIRKLPSFVVNKLPEEVTFCAETCRSLATDIKCVLRSFLLKLFSEVCLFKIWNENKVTGHVGSTSMMLTNITMVQPVTK